jgi:putative oxidoreductase
MLNMDQGLLLARVVIGLLMAGHGSQKLFGWFGGYGLAGVSGYLESLGFRPGKLFALAASVGEVLSGLLILSGFLGPIGPALMLSVMIVAAVAVHWRNGLFVTSNGIEVPLLYGILGVTLALTGFGRFSLDALLGLTLLWTPAVVWAVIVVGIAGGAASLVLRRPAVEAKA